MLRSKNQLFQLIGFAPLCISLIIFISAEGAHPHVCPEQQMEVPQHAPLIGIACNLLGLGFWLRGTIDG